MAAERTVQLATGRRVAGPGLPQAVFQHPQLERLPVKRQRAHGHVFDILAKHHVKVNVMQNSAISFSLCVDAEHFLGSACIKALQKDYTVRYNDGLELYTIRHYTPSAIKRISKNREVLLEQKTRNTVHLVVK